MTSRRAVNGVRVAIVLVGFAVIGSFFLLQNEQAIDQIFHLFLLFVVAGTAGIAVLEKRDGNTKRFVTSMLVSIIFAVFLIIR